MTPERIGELEVVRHGPADGRALVFHVGTLNAPDEFPLLTDALDSAAKGAVWPTPPATSPPSSTR